MEVALAVLGIVSTVLGIVWWYLKRKPPKTKLERKHEAIVKSRAKISKAKWLLRKRKLRELEDVLDDEDARLAAIGLRVKDVPSDGDETPGSD